MGDIFRLEPQHSYQVLSPQQQQQHLFMPSLQPLQSSSLPSPSGITTSESTDSLRGTLQKHEQMEWEQYSAENKKTDVNIGRIDSISSSCSSKLGVGDDEELSGICAGRNGGSNSRIGSEEPSPTSAAWLSPSSQGSFDSSSQISGVWEKRFSKKGTSEKIRAPPSILFEHLSPAMQQQPAGRLPLTSESVWEDSEDEDQGYKKGSSSSNSGNKSSSAGRRGIPKWYCLLCCVSSRVVPRNKRNNNNNNNNNNKNDPKHTA